MVIKLEIQKMDEKKFGKDKWAIRSGDIEGSTELSNFSKEEIIDFIKDELQGEDA